MEGAVRLFAGEWNQSTFAVTGEDDRSTVWVVTPTGAYCRQVFLAGALVGLHEEGDILSARLADPTGGFDLIFGGRNTALAESVRKIPLPSFVSVAGRSQMYRSGGNVVLTIRPEHVLVIDRRIRDRWIITTAHATLERLRTMLSALKDPGADIRIRQAAAHYSLSDKDLASLAEMVEGALSNIQTAQGKEDAREADPREMILEYIRAMAGPRGVAVDDIIGMARTKGVTQESVLTVLESLIVDDECYQPQKGFVRLL